MNTWCETGLKEPPDTENQIFLLHVFYMSIIYAYYAWMEKEAFIPPIRIIHASIEPKFCWGETDCWSVRRIYFVYTSKYQWNIIGWLLENHRRFNFIQKEQLIIVRLLRSLKWKEGTRKSITPQSLFSLRKKLVFITNQTTLLLLKVIFYHRM